MMLDLVAVLAVVVACLLPAVLLLLPAVLLLPAYGRHFACSHQVMRSP
jgi:hypothetical protein